MAIGSQRLRSLNAIFLLSKHEEDASIGLWAPVTTLSCHEVDGVRKEKERLTAAPPVTMDMESQILSKQKTSSSSREIL